MKVLLVWFFLLRGVVKLIVCILGVEMKVVVVFMYFLGNNFFLGDCIGFVCLGWVCVVGCYLFGCLVYLFVIFIMFLVVIGLVFWCV